MISIVIPVYNVESYIDRCIESILSQTFKDYEVVLVDDGSSDCSGQICDKYAEEHSNIKAIHITNGGVSNARNTGIKEACGEWITFVDADDYLESTHLEALYNAVDDNQDLAVCDYRIVSENGDIIKPQILPSDFPGNFTRTEALEDMGRGTSIWGYVWNKLFKREIIISNGLFFDSQIKIWEDMLYCAEYIAFCSDIRVVSNSSYNYIVRAGSAVNSKSFELSSTKYSACEKFTILLEKLISYNIVNADSIFAAWVRRVFAETCLDGILNAQFKNGIYDKQLINRYLAKVDEYSQYISTKQKFELILLKACPYIIYRVKRK